MAGGRSKGQRKRLGFEQFEARMMMHGGSLGGDDGKALIGPIQSSSAGAGSTVLASSAVANIAGDKLVAYFPTNRDVDVQMGLPMLDSLPGAAATLYLDFDGNYMGHWTDGSKDYYNITTPVFDTDGNTANFSATEQAQIKDVWSRVAEDYAPFNINVSTDYYGAFDNKVALHVVIGGDNGDWLHANASGISYIGSFSNDQPNVVFAFDMFKWAAAGVTDGDGRVLVGPAAMATTISHEAGHAFGLHHHALYKVDGTKITDYDPGSGGWTPIMGENKASDRTTWDAGPTDQGPNSYQDDVAVISSAANGFGLRADDHGSSQATADWMTSPMTIFGAWTGKGIVNSHNDFDMLKFTTTGGKTTIDVKAIANGPNLIPIAQLWSASGPLANATGGSLTESIITTNLAAGTYYVQIHGYGDYGDMGQYTVSAATSMLTAGNTTVMAAPMSMVGGQTVPGGAVNPGSAAGTLAQSLKTTSLMAAALGSRSAGSGQTPLALGQPNREGLVLATLAADSQGGKRKQLAVLDRFDLDSLDAVYDFLGAPKFARRVG